MNIMYRAMSISGTHISISNIVPFSTVKYSTRRTHSFLCCCCCCCCCCSCWCWYCISAENRDTKSSTPIWSLRSVDERVIKSWTLLGHLIGDTLSLEDARPFLPIIYHHKRRTACIWWYDTLHFTSLVLMSIKLSLTDSFFFLCQSKSFFFCASGTIYFFHCESERCESFFHCDDEWFFFCESKSFSLW